LLGLQHDREFRKVEATHVNERAGPLLGRHTGGMSQSVAHLAQRHQPKRWRQIERGLRRRAQARALSQGHLAPGLAKVVCNTYNVLRTGARAARCHARRRASRSRHRLAQSPETALTGPSACADDERAKYVAPLAQPETKWPTGRQT